MTEPEKHIVALMSHLYYYIFLSILGSNTKLLYAVNLISFFKQANKVDIEPWC